MRLDDDLRARCLAAGLDPNEVQRKYTETGSIGPVLACIAAAETDVLRRQAEDADRREREADAGPVGVGSRRWRRDMGRSFTMSVRLDHDEIAELRRCASAQSIGVSVLARSYIRKGLAREIALSAAPPRDGRSAAPGA